MSRSARSVRRELHAFCYKELKAITRDFSEMGYMLFNWSQLQPYGLTALSQFPAAGQALTHYIKRRSPLAGGEVVLVFSNASDQSGATIYIVYYRQEDVDSRAVQMGEAQDLLQSLVLGDPSLN
ncbi:MAG TPA: hypothetical protein VMR75_00380 [Candidatus Saccharimonadales bacterium]|nr:hypothetical protein [Candidatus Saccharimonadales bacterium]